MAERWTIKQLNEIDDLGFIIDILQERRNKLTRLMPLEMKLGRVISKLSQLRNMRDPANMVKLVNEMQQIPQQKK